MKNKLRYLWMILLVISLVCAAAGCGRGDDGADSGTGRKTDRAMCRNIWSLTRK